MFVRDERPERLHAPFEPEPIRADFGELVFEFGFERALLVILGLLQPQLRGELVGI